MRSWSRCARSQGCRCRQICSGGACLQRRAGSAQRDPLGFREAGVSKGRRYPDFPKRESISSPGAARLGRFTWVRFTSTASLGLLTRAGCWVGATGHRASAIGHPPRVPATAHPPRRTGHRASATGHRPPATGHRPPATGHPPPATGHRASATGHRPPATGHPPPATRHRASGIGHRASATGHGHRRRRGLPATGYRHRAPGGKNFSLGCLGCRGRADGHPPVWMRSHAQPTQLWASTSGVAI
ncbi:hypothetical protein HNR22_002554 [Micromonospora jinlongensis]|uniref:Uncharacterized protein n=1 Tax=Micromonospora jinlongensis TaxID=1287877 RepID=A0A7Y9X091_9ACTN|nr:hypothetical protein [Micromonospora jinlongensis]